MPTRRRALLVLAALTGLAVLSLLVALAAGSMAVSASAMSSCAIGDSGDGLAVEVIRGLRLPRALAAFACGGLLALAGALMQVLLRNPLADPYVLGISGGASVGALSAMLAGLALAFINLVRLRRRASPPCCWCSAWPTATAAGPAPACC
jgi:iron complex transport system permease protein